MRLQDKLISKATQKKAIGKKIFLLSIIPSALNPKAPLFRPATIHYKPIQISNISLRGKEQDHPKILRPLRAYLL